MQMHFTKRAAVVAGATVLVIGGAVGVGVAASGSPGEEETPATTTSSTGASATTTKPIEVTEPTLASGFEDYTPGGELPAPPVTSATLTEGQTVPTVQGPHGPIYPDGHVEAPVSVPPDFSTVPPPRPSDQPPG